MATALALLFAPAFFVRLLFRADITGAALVLARLAGIALLSMSVGWWPGPWRVSALIYNSLAALYLLDLGIRGEWVGLLLWPAVVVHAVLAVLFALTIAKQVSAGKAVMNPNTD
jgi:hypothetical protein